MKKNSIAYSSNFSKQLAIGSMEYRPTELLKMQLIVHNYWVIKGKIHLISLFRQLSETVSDTGLFYTIYLLANVSVKNPLRGITSSSDED